MSTALKCGHYFLNRSFPASLSFAEVRSEHPYSTRASFTSNITRRQLISPFLVVGVLWIQQRRPSGTRSEPCYGSILDLAQKMNLWWDGVLLLRRVACYQYTVIQTTQSAHCLDIPRNTKCIDIDRNLCQHNTHVGQYHFGCHHHSTKSDCRMSIPPQTLPLPMTCRRTSGNTDFGKSALDFIRWQRSFIFQQKPYS